MPANGPPAHLLNGWGRTAPSSAVTVAPSGCAEMLEAACADTPRGVIPRGLGRSYGDAAQNAGGLVLSTAGLDRLLALDPETGSVTVEAGMTVGRMSRILLQQGLFVPVTPGTRAVTIGGAIAADIHGKNHHRDGSIGRHVERMTLASAAGDVRVLTPEPGGDPELFWGTLGGMGLTGVVLEATLRTFPVESPWLSVDMTRAGDLDGLLAALSVADVRQYSVAWVDCMAGGRHTGRGVVSSADHMSAAEELTSRTWRRATPDPDPPPRVRAPGWSPSGLLNRWSVAAFNAAWYHAAPRHRVGARQSPATFFHPLDGVADWNRLYGPHGLVQYQCVVPDTATVERLLTRFRLAHAPSFLAVLKRFGAGNSGPLSFPRPGWTLALDMPASLGGLPPLLDDLDEIVAAAGGSVYLAKDSRMRPDLLGSFYPRLDRWHELRDRIDPTRRWQSDLSRRLSL